MSKEAKTAFLILLFLSSGLLLPISGAIQRYEFSSELNQNRPEEFFFAVLPDGKSTLSNPSPSTAGGNPNQGIFSQMIPSNPSEKGNDFFVRVGSTFFIFPLTPQENGGTTQIPFAPILLVWLDSERRRSRFRIYVEILEILKKRPMSPYEISFCLRLNSKRARQYVDFLIEKGYLEVSVIDRREICTVTANGKMFVDGMKTILEKE